MNQLSIIDWYNIIVNGRTTQIGNQIEVPIDLFISLLKVNINAPHQRRHFRGRWKSDGNKY